MTSFPTTPRASAIRATALVLVWSSGFIGAELGARAAPPATSLAWRFLVTAVVLLPWLLRGGGLDRREWACQAVLALLCQCLYLAGVFQAAAAGVPAGTSALIASLQPALVLTAAVLLGSSRLKAGHVVGLVLGSAGVALTAAGDLRAGVDIAALVLPLSAMLSLSAGTLLQQRWTTSDRPTPLMRTLAVQAVFGAVFFTAYAAATGDLAPPPTARFWTATTWAVLAGIGSYGAYYLVTTHDGAPRASTLLYITPAATALWATLMFAQPLRTTTIAGLLVSALAVAVFTRSDSTPRTQPAPTRPHAEQGTPAQGDP
ncbi:DMT family transporter [Umezawaea sp. Da 62-37]|uniref:DMT family transporter n=1 Tax=Umezawaea sp. Da 62-37 TaxID=3075927 RepID=UPI0028F70A9C|nr:DMT family transporter [Umezawaea sp. Da 62-37]WNV90729.1 DMT family transporter [Umezawaea sp. Da 62-37]